MTRLLAFLMLGTFTALFAVGQEKEKPKALPKVAADKAKIAVFNVAKVMKEFTKWQYWSATMQNKRFVAQQELIVLREEVMTFAKRMETETDKLKKEELTNKHFLVQREFEDKERSARKALDEESSMLLKTMYIEIQSAVNELVTDEGFSIVFTHIDATTIEEKQSPMLIDMKMRPNGAVPFFVSDTADVSKALVKKLNAKFKAPGAVPQIKAQLTGTDMDFFVSAQEGEKPNPFINPKAVPKPEPKKEDQPKKADPDAPAPRVAHIKISGSLGESPTADGPFGGGSENLRSKIDRIRKATQDERIKALYLELGSLEIGFGKLHELQAAIKEFRAAGKKAFAYSEELDTKAYLLALACDSISLPESGGLNLFGMRAEVSFYKDLLKLVSLEVDVLKMGKYKSAVEPFLFDKMSAENREQMQSLLNDNFDNELVGAIVKGRPTQKFTAEQVEAIIDGGPYTAKKAAKLGLVDSLQYQDEFEAGFAKQLGVPEVRILHSYGKAKSTGPDFSNPLAMLEMLNPKKPAESKDPKIAVIHVVGGISSGTGSVSPMSGGESAGSDTIVEAIRDAEKNPTVKAIVLRVDSPGGSALASDMIWRALGVCKKPVVTSMGDVAASGGYYVAMNSKKIFAEPGTITGSIGVFGMKIVTGGLEERVGVKTEVISRGKNSGVNSMTFKWNETERKAMTDTIDDVYAQFIDKALAGRIAAGQKAMTREKLLELAGGRVWTGRQAKERGLVDELGTLDDAIAYAKKEAGIDPKTEMELLNLPKAQSFLDKLMDGKMELPFGLKSELKMLPGVEKALRNLAPILGSPKDRVKMVMPFVVEFK